MSQKNTDGAESDKSLPVSALPPKALQAIYHAATGKTETIRRKIRKNVLINKGDIEALYHRLSQEYDIHDRVCEPTVTINVHLDEDVNQQYSSWERFKNIQHLNQTVTSSFILKIESVIRLPNTEKDQRLVIEVCLDSSLPVLIADQKNAADRIDFGWMLIDRNIWETVDVKIDFVDYVVAKNFLHIVESWIERLPPSDQGRSSNKIAALIPIIGKIGPQTGLIGAGAFLITYAYSADLTDLGNLCVAFGLMYVLWGAGEILRKNSFEALLKSTAKSKIPSVLVLNDLDQRKYDEILINSGPAARTSFKRMLGVFTSSFLINILASIFYAKFFVH